MPIVFLRPRILHSVLSIVAALLWTGAAIACVEVFTIAGEPVVNVHVSTAVIELDAPARLDARISHDLPADPERARQMMQSRMSGPDWQATLKRYGELYTGIARAWMLGIRKVPAVVVYGEPDVQVALKEIALARGKVNDPHPYVTSTGTGRRDDHGCGRHR